MQGVTALMVVAPYWFQLYPALFVSLKKFPKNLSGNSQEATDGFEPTIRELQSHALPLG